ncbi:LAMI_0C09010g1_1 [Lachancea mirantina]|uniref:LAMI_0C09010g1_1 n=1 Tax=Lachancea mirantina TaxID=1230905 RepID=A0A1G4J540_9SACH|nr:LAMI_0C09010g1_1 [Lachancea mirantina]
MFNRLARSQWGLIHGRINSGSVRAHPLFYRAASTYIRKSNSKSKSTVHRQKTEAEEKLEKQLNSSNRFVRWGAIARSEDFRKGMTKYLIGAYVLFLLYGLQYMKKLYAKERELEDLEERQENGIVNEYEELRIKELRGKLRRRDESKLQKYQQLMASGETNFDGLVFPEADTNKTNAKILPARDTTSFYEQKASEYDAGVNFEEKAIFMGRRRKWLMQHCKGDVLEVASGTGRNVKYLDPARINSITFLDSSQKMMELTHEKFKKQLPNFKKAAFVVGKAEDLVQIAGGDAGASSATLDGMGDVKVKYDTIIEAFGLCSHEDPVKALQNFEKLLKPGGRIVLLEHGRGNYDIINKILDDRAEKRLETWGCRWNLDLGEILDDSGLEVTEEKRTHLGTTWCIVAKKKGDQRTTDEIGFYEKYLGSSIKNKIEAQKERNQQGTDNSR